MNKVDLIADLNSKGLRVIAVTQQSDPVKEAAGVNSYIANVMEQRGDTVTARNVGFYVMDEGEAGEVAYYRDQLSQKNVAYDAMVSYIDGLTPATYIRGEVQNVNEDGKYGFAKVYKDNGDGTAKEVQLIVFKNGANPIEHRELS